MAQLNNDAVMTALATVDDPEIGKPITELGMVDNIDIADDRLAVTIKLTIPGCPLKNTITENVTSALAPIAGDRIVHVDFSSMTDDERSELSSQLRAERGAANPQMSIPFAEPGNQTKVIAIASGKGGVGKSTVTVNLAAALAAQGHEVGVLDADIWGYSIPRMLGVDGAPVAIDGMVMPLQGHGCKVISIGFFADPERAVLWRGPMLHRALQQFLADVWWGDLDYLLMDLPPGTGDVTITLAQTLPNADMIVVTTPQPAAQTVAKRAGRATEQAGMKVVGVIENMAGFTDDNGVQHDLFGSGGGQALASELDTELLGSIPLDPRLREGSDNGTPLVVSDPDAAASKVFTSLAEQIDARRSSIRGKSLPVA